MAGIKQVIRSDVFTNGWWLDWGQNPDPQYNVSLARRGAMSYMFQLRTHPLQSGLRVNGLSYGLPETVITVNPHGPDVTLHYCNEIDINCDLSQGEGLLVAELDSEAAPSPRNAPIRLFFKTPLQAVGMHVSGVGANALGADFEAVLWVRRNGNGPWEPPIRVRGRLGSTIPEGPATAPFIGATTNGEPGITEARITISSEKRRFHSVAIGSIQGVKDGVIQEETVVHRKDDAEYMVWYGTNRRLVDPTDTRKGYSPERDTTVHYGSCYVFIPKSHKTGSTGSPWWKRLFISDDRLQLRDVTSMSTEVYWREIANHLKTIATDERHALVFVHGYNVSFKDAALRAAQIGFDLSIRGAMAFFSWPSQGRLDGYAADAAAIEASESAITNFLVDFADRAGAEAVHIIAHSMGNRGVLRAVDRIAQQAQSRSKKKRFGQVILAAADVDTDLFLQRCAAYVQLAQRTTLYVSTRDRAIEASHWLYGSPRVGLMPPIVVAPGIDTVNVMNMDLTLLGHGYIAEASGVLGDMHDLISRGAPPEKRFRLRAGDEVNGKKFWFIGA